MIKDAFNTKNCQNRCKLTDCKDIGQAKFIDLSGCDLDVIPDSLVNMEHLEALDVSNNNFSIIEKMDNLNTLRYLNVGSNKITSISGLDNLKNLRTLRFPDNSIKKIEGLDNLTKLEKLDLRNNKIYKIEGLDNLMNLKRIELEGNPLESIDDRMMLMMGVEIDDAGVRLQREEIARNVVYVSKGKTERLNE